MRSDQHDPVPAISGKTRIIAHLGVPTESFKAPMIYNPWFAAKGIDCVVVPMGCEAADFPDFLRLVFRLRNIAGALITMPHKGATPPLMDTVSPAARVCGACNAVRLRDGRLEGDMFDGEGFVRGVLRAGRNVEGASAIIAGCGGVGSAIAASLAAAGASRLSLFDIREGAAAALALRLQGHFPGLVTHVGPSDPKDHDIVVNATPLGMEPGDALPFDTARIDARSFVGEVVMQAEETPFLKAARARGCHTLVGTDMLFEQIPAYLDFFGFPAATPGELRKLARIRY